MRRARHHIARFDFDFGAEPRDRHDEEIDRPRADRATAWHRDARLAHASDQRRQHPEACPHFGDELVGRRGVDNTRRGDVQGLAVIGGLTGAFATHHDVDAVIAENAFEQGHIGQPRHIVEDQSLLGEQARDHQRQRGVFRSGNRNRAVEGAAADDTNAIHALIPWARSGPNGLDLNIACPTQNGYLT
jgi:hypothetical protein